MNKLCIDTNFYSLVISKSDSYFLEIKKDTTLSIVVLENIEASMAILNENCKIRINIELKNNSIFKMNQLGINSNIDYSCHLLSGSNLLCVTGILTKIDSCNLIKIIHTEKDSSAKFLINGLNLNDNKLYFTIDGIIEKNAINTILEENSKIINLKKGDSKIIPNLIVDNNDVTALHSAFIGTFPKDAIWYLNARGIDNSLVKKILAKSVLLSGMTLDFDKDKFVKSILDNIIDL